jgi:hypothetical protein
VAQSDNLRTYKIELVISVRKDTSSPLVWLPDCIYDNIDMPTGESLLTFNMEELNS